MKKKNHSFTILVIICIMLIIISIIFFKYSSAEKPLPESTSSISLNEKPSSEAASEEFQGEEESEIRAYISNICNTNLGNRLPEFNDINNAYKPWIYSHITHNDNTYFLTEDEIRQNLKEIFGDKLIIDVKKDTSEYDDISMPTYDKENDDYILPAFGLDNQIHYTINSIQKTDDTYTIQVIECNIMSDFDTNELIISAYSKNNSDKNKTEIFRASKDENINTIENEIIKQKDKFTVFNITIKKNNNQFHIQKITAE